MKLDRYKSIALLDSGVGGLTVAREIMRQLPYESIVYFGDTARMPYGPRPHEQVRGFVSEIIEFLYTQEIKAIIVACNSATAACSDYYRNGVGLPMLGVIEPGVNAALRYTVNKRVGVIGTTGTINSGAYQKVFQRLAPDVELFEQPCPLFVLIVENGLVATREAYRVAEEYLQPLKEAGVDVLILGCTHYPLMMDVIQEVMGLEVKLVSSAQETAREAKMILEEMALISPNKAGLPLHRFFVSGSARPFIEIATKLLGREVIAYQVVLDQKTSFFDLD